MNPLKTKQDGHTMQNAIRCSDTHDRTDKGQSKPVQYIVPGLYLTPFGERRRGCLKARC